MQRTGAGNARGGEFADEGEGILVVPLAAWGGPASGWNQGGAEVRDEQGGLPETGEVAQALNDLRAGEQWGRRGDAERGIPVVEAVPRAVAEEPREKIGGGGVEGLIVGEGVAGVPLAASSARSARRKRIASLICCAR